MQIKCAECGVPSKNFVKAMSRVINADVLGNEERGVMA
jgi:hypothetical protein